MKTKICQKCHKLLPIDKFCTYKIGERKEKLYTDKTCNACRYRRDILKYKDKRRLTQKRYFQTPKGIYAVLLGNLWHIKRRNLSICSREDFLNWYKNEKQQCHYCKRNFFQTAEDGNLGKVSRLTIDRMDNKKGYIIGNMALSCKLCNTIKGEFFTEQEMFIIGNLIFKRTNE